MFSSPPSVHAVTAATVHKTIAFTAGFTRPLQHAKAAYNLNKRVDKIFASARPRSTRPRSQTGPSVYHPAPPVSVSVSITTSAEPAPTKSAARAPPSSWNKLKGGRTHRIAVREDKVLPPLPPRQDPRYASHEALALCDAPNRKRGTIPTWTDAAPPVHPMSRIGQRILTPQEIAAIETEANMRATPPHCRGPHSLSPPPSHHRRRGPDAVVFAPRENMAAHPAEQHRYHQHSREAPMKFPF